MGACKSYLRVSQLWVVAVSIIDRSVAKANAISREHTAHQLDINLMEQPKSPMHANPSKVIRICSASRKTCLHGVRARATVNSGGI